MEAILQVVCPIFVWVFAAFHLVLMIVQFKSYSKTKEPLFLISAFVIFGLFYDALILSLGTVLPEGALLKGLSQVRYISHGALIPLLIPICAYALNFKKTGKTVVWIITGLLIASGIASGIATVTVPEHFGVVRYAMDKTATPFWAYIISTTVLAFGMDIPLLIAGIIVWIKQKTPALFLSGFFMFVFSALGAVCMNYMFFISMPGELLMALFFYIYSRSRCKKKA